MIAGAAGGLVLLVILGAIVGFRRGADDPATRGLGFVKPGAVAPEGEARDATSEAALSESAESQPAEVSVLPDLPGQRVIKNAQLEVRVAKDSFQDKFNSASRVAEEFGGFVTGSQTSETEGRIASGTITMRIPSERFQAALARLRELGEVSAENQSGQDVTSEFVDLEARLRHLKSQETFYLRLMDQARTISDMIQIQQQLQSVQLQIEQIQGRLEFLRDQTSLASVSVRLFEAGAAPFTPGTLGRAWKEATDGFVTVIGGMVVVAGWIAPVVLLGLLGLGVWKVTRPKPAV